MPSSYYRAVIWGGNADVALPRLVESRVVADARAGVRVFIPEGHSALDEAVGRRARLTAGQCVRDCARYRG